MLGRRAWISPPPSRIAVEGGDSCGPQSPLRLDTGVGLAPGPLPPPSRHGQGDTQEVVTYILNIKEYVYHFMHKNTDDARHTEAHSGVAAAATPHHKSGKRRDSTL